MWYLFIQMHKQTFFSFIFLPFWSYFFAKKQFFVSIVCWQNICIFLLNKKQNYLFCKLYFFNKLYCFSSISILVLILMYFIINLLIISNNYYSKHLYLQMFVYIVFQFIFINNFFYYILNKFIYKAVYISYIPSMKLNMKYMC